MKRGGWALIAVAVLAIGPAGTALGQDSCKTKECLEQKSYEIADATMTAGEWLEATKLPHSSPEYLKAILIAGTVLFDWNGKSHCKPERANVNQAMAVAEQFFEEHPQIWHLDAPNGIAAALGNVWPCSAANGT